MKLLRTFVSSLSTCAALMLLSNCKSVSSGHRLESGLSSTGASSSELTRLELKTAQDYADFSTESSGLIAGGKSVKFLIDFKGGASRTPQQIYFINANYKGNCKYKDPEAGAICWKYHYDFAREQLNIRESLEQFNAKTYFENTNKASRETSKTYAAGTLSTYALNDKIVYAIQLYPNDTANLVSVLEISRIVRNAVKIPGSDVVFLPTGDQLIFPGMVDSLAKLQVGYTTLDKILNGRTFIPMHAGEAYGHIRMFPKDQESLLPTDIVVFDELPLDLSVVAGVITRAFQDTNSHINLKSKERKTPNMVLRDAGPDHEALNPWIDKPVHLVVTNDGWEIKASTDQEVQAQYQKRRSSTPWIPMAKPEDSPIVPFVGMCPGAPEKCLSFSRKLGSKAANLGFLTEVLKDRRVRKVRRTYETVAYDLVPKGFGIPLKFYGDLVDANPALKQRLAEFVKDEMDGKLSNTQRSEQSAEIRQMFLDAEVPPANLKAVLDQMTAINPNVVEWKIRSSANAEDVENFDGAGLHDSYASKTDKKDKADHTCKLVENPGDEPGEMTKMKVSPKTVACAMKGVYASLWNKRAIDERSFAHIDHSTVTMGLAVLPTYDNEGPVAANSVVVTRIVNSEVTGISLSIQDKNNTVTNPTPGTYSEVAMAVGVSEDEDITLSTVRYAKPLADKPVRTKNVLVNADTLFMTEIARKVEEAYCQANLDYYYNARYPIPESSKGVVLTKQQRERQTGYRVAEVCKDVSFDNTKPKALDFEMKVICKSSEAECKNAEQVDRTKLKYEFIAKQVREFAGH